DQTQPVNEEKEKDKEKEKEEKKEEKINKAEKEEDEEIYEDSNLEMKDDPFFDWVLQINDARHYLSRVQFRSLGNTMQSLEEIAQVALDKMSQYCKELLEQQRSQSVRSIEKIIELNIPLDWYNRDPHTPLWPYQVTGNVRKQVLESINPFLPKHPVFEERKIMAIPRDFPIYITWSTIKLLSNLVYSIDDTCDCFKPLLQNSFYSLLVDSRQDLLSILLSPSTGLSDEVILCMQYITAQRRLRIAEEQKQESPRSPDPVNSTKQLTFENLQSQSKKDKKKGTLFIFIIHFHKYIHTYVYVYVCMSFFFFFFFVIKKSLCVCVYEEVKTNDEIDMDDFEADMSNKEDDAAMRNYFSIEGTMELNAKLNTGLERLQLPVEILHHPIILFLVLSLTFLQMERHLCEKVLRKSNNANSTGLLLSAICDSSLEHIAVRIDQVLKMEDTLSFSRPTILRMSTQQNFLFFFFFRVSMHPSILNFIIYAIFFMCVFVVGHNIKPAGPSEYDTIVAACASIANISGNNVATNVRVDMETLRYATLVLFLKKKKNKTKQKTNRWINNHLYSRIQKIIEHRENKPRPDGGYHPLVIETVELISNIYTFRNTIEELCQSWDEEVNKTNSTDEALHSENPLYKYELPSLKVLLVNRPAYTSGIQQVLSELARALQINLQEKSKQYGNSKVLRVIFLLNNFHYIVKSISDTPLEEACGKNEIENLRKEVADLKSKYLKESWGKIEPCLDIENDPLTKKTTNLKRGERDAAKKKFKTFNDEFAVQYEMQKEYSVPDSSLRADLQEKNKKMVGSKYAEVWRRYENIDFTTNKSKYFIYPPKQLEAMLDQFFEPN
ncbi:hypothetical protein RFI_23661, partial [Reticulomyxa filosa]